jgi:apolipoprotein N-acyltransferase
MGRRTARGFRQHRQRKLILGVPRLEGAGSGDQRAYNSLAVLSGDADVRGARHWYDKHMLVPFGEFMPFAGALKAIGLQTLQDLAPGGFEAGPMPSSVRVDGIPAFGPLICYEVIFPGLSPTGDDRPDWLVNISIDAWFGEFLGPGQHAAQARYRSHRGGLADGACRQPRRDRLHRWLWPMDRTRRARRSGALHARSRRLAVEHR